MPYIFIEKKSEYNIHGSSHKGQFTMYYFYKLSKLKFKTFFSLGVKSIEFIFLFFFTVFLDIFY